MIPSFQTFLVVVSEHSFKHAPTFHLPFLPSRVAYREVLSPLKNPRADRGRFSILRSSGLWESTIRSPNPNLADTAAPPFCSVFWSAGRPRALQHEPKGGGTGWSHSHILDRPIAVSSGEGRRWRLETWLEAGGQTVKRWVSLAASGDIGRHRNTEIGFMGHT